MSKVFTDEEIERIQEIVDSIPDYFDAPEEIQCPHCGETQGFESADYGIYTEDSFVHNCYACNKGFSITGSMSWSWSTDKDAE